MTTVSYDSSAGTVHFGHIREPSRRWRRLAPQSRQRGRRRQKKMVPSTSVAKMIQNMGSPSFPPEREDGMGHREGSRMNSQPAPQAPQGAGEDDGMSLMHCPHLQRRPGIGLINTVVCKPGGTRLDRMPIRVVPVSKCVTCGHSVAGGAS